MQYKIQILNKISDKGLAMLEDGFQIVHDDCPADAILLRSHALHDMTISNTLQVVARAGVGVNNIPVSQLTEIGVPVLNTPGANANAVKELVIAGMLLACRHICGGWAFAKTLRGDAAAMTQAVELGKKAYVGSELPGKTLSVVGLGSVGVEVANIALALGMRVIGYDPAITIQRAWQLSSSVEKASTLKDAIEAADFVSFHVPLLPSTRHMVDDAALRQMRPGTVVINFARGELVDVAAMEASLQAEHIKAYVTDFPHPVLQHPQVIALPHLGASTQEAQDNCAVMAVSQLQAYLRDGHIGHSVNFPFVRMPRNGSARLAVVNANIPNMVGQISTALADANLNIVDMINKSRESIAYTLMDVDKAIPVAVTQSIKAIEGVLKVRVI